METSVLAGQRLLVIGGSSGIGRKVAIRAAELRASVAVSARRTDLLATLAEEIGCLVATIDVEDAGSDVAVGQLAERLGGVDLMVVAAGVTPMCSLDSMSTAEWARVFAVNVTGPNMAIKGALPYFSADAQIVVISSDVAGDPRTGMIPYAASKSALDDTLRGWRIEHPELRVSRVALGATTGTDIGREIDRTALAELVPVWIEHGKMLTGWMKGEHVAEQIVANLAIGVQCSDLVVDSYMLRPRGGLQTLATRSTAGP